MKKNQIVPFARPKKDRSAHLCSISQIESFTLSDSEAARLRAALNNTDHLTFIWVEPGQVAEIAPDLHLSIQYDCSDGDYHPVFQLWCGTQRIKDIQPDQNNQVDLTESARLVITIVNHDHNTRSGRIYRTLIQIHKKP